MHHGHVGDDDALLPQPPQPAQDRALGQADPLGEDPRGVRLSTWTAARSAWSKRSRVTVSGMTGPMMAKTAAG